MSYGVKLTGLWRQIAGHAKPADLPIEQPTKFELIINLKTATATRHFAFVPKLGSGTVIQSRRRRAREALAGS
jgi:hypothetical protein